MVWVRSIGEAVDAINRNKATELWVRVPEGISCLSPISDALAKNTSLRSLNLRGNGISRLSPLGTQKMGCLTHLYLGDNNITDISDLANNLKTNCHLSVLHLDQNLIVNVEGLGEALLMNNTLTVLILDDNQIRDVSTLGRALRCNRKLMALYLKANQISDVTSIANGMKENNSLQELSLRNNRLVDATDLVAALKHNHKLRYLSLDQNPLSAPSPIWKSFGKRKPPVVEACVCLQEYRTKKRDFRAFASVLGLGCGERNRWIFDDLVMANILEFLWNSTSVANELEVKVTELFGHCRDGKEILRWLMEDLSTSDVGGCSATVIFTSTRGPSLRTS